MSMTSDEISTIPKELWDYAEMPYGGLFGRSVIVRIVEEMIANHTGKYRIKDLSEIIGASENQIANILKVLLRLKLVKTENIDTRWPLYTINEKSKQAVALSLLALGVLDDRDGSNSMNAAIEHYYLDILERTFPYTFSLYSNYDAIQTYTHVKPSIQANNEINLLNSSIGCA